MHADARLRALHRRNRCEVGRLAPSRGPPAASRTRSRGRCHLNDPELARCESVEGPWPNRPPDEAQRGKPDGSRHASDLSVLALADGELHPAGGDVLSLSDGWVSWSDGWRGDVTRDSRPGGAVFERDTARERRQGFLGDGSLDLGPVRLGLFELRRGDVVLQRTIARQCK